MVGDAREPETGVWILRDPCSRGARVPPKKKAESPVSLCFGRFLDGPVVWFLCHFVPRERFGHLCDVGWVGVW